MFDVWKRTPNLPIRLQKYQRNSATEYSIAGAADRFAGIWAPEDPILGFLEYVL
jgi:hypothetical protein